MKKTEREIREELLEIDRREGYDFDDFDGVGIYSSKNRESMLDDDELSPMEVAFMNGYEDAFT